MQQPELGQKVAELRQQKGWTQEHLAEMCEVSTRTIQRIESGEVDPRAFTMNRLREILGFDFERPEIESQRMWVILMHLSSVFPLVVFPLLVWSWGKDRSRQIDRHGRDVLNFQITMLLLICAGAFLLFLFPVLFSLLSVQAPRLRFSLGLAEVLILAIPVPLLCGGLFGGIQAVVNTTRILSGKSYRYFPVIPFIR